MNRQINGTCSSPYLSPAKLTTPRRAGSASATDRATAIQRSFSCRSRREEEEVGQNEAQSKKTDNQHWSKIRKMTKEQYFTKQTTKNLKNAANTQKSNGHPQITTENRNSPVPTRCSPETKDSKHWSKVRRMTKAGFFMSAKIMAHPPTDNAESETGTCFSNESDGYRSKNSPPTSARQISKFNDRLNRAKSAPQKDRKSDVVVVKSLRSILKQRTVPSNVRYIDYDTGETVTFNDLIQYRRRSSIASNSSRTTFNDAEGRPMTSYTVGQESKFINTVNIIQNFDVPKKELQVLDMKKMTPFKYVYILSKCLPQIVSKNFRSSAVPAENDPIYRQRIRENQPPTSRPQTPSSTTDWTSPVTETTTELNLVSA